MGSGFRFEDRTGCKQNKFASDAEDLLEDLLHEDIFANPRVYQSEEAEKVTSILRNSSITLSEFYTLWIYNKMLDNFWVKKKILTN